MARGGRCMGEVAWRKEDGNALTCTTMRVACRHSVHRKPWEWATGLTALQDLGMLKKSKVGVEVGAGAQLVFSAS